MIPRRSLPISFPVVGPVAFLVLGLPLHHGSRLRLSPVVGDYAPPTRRRDPFLCTADTSVISGAMLLLKDDFDLTTFQQEMVVSMTVVGAFVGSIIGGWIGSG